MSNLTLHFLTLLFFQFQLFTKTIMATQVGYVKSVFPVATTRKISHCQSSLLPCRIGYTARVSHVPLVKKVSSDAVRISCCSNNARESDFGAEKLEETEKSYSVVMKFGGSSVANAVRMKEIANLILSFPEERPIIVLSAMGKTTNKLLLVFPFYLLPVLYF